MLGACYYVIFLSIFYQYKGLNKSAYSLFFSRMITAMGSFVYPLFTLIMTQKMGYSATGAAYVGLVMGVATVPVLMLGGKLCDIFDKKKLIVILDILTVISYLICSQLDPTIYLIVSIFVAGLFAKMKLPVMDSLVIETVLYDDRERIFSLNYLGYNLGFILAPLVGGLLFENYLSLAFAITAVTTLSSTIVIIIFVKKINIYDITPTNEYEVSNYKSSLFHLFLERKTLFVFILLASLSGFIYQQWGFLVPIYMSDLFGENGAMYYGYAAATNGAVVIIVTPILTRTMANRYELTKKKLSYLMYTTSFTVLCFFTDLPIFFIMITLLTIGEVFELLCNLPYLSRRVPSSHRGRVTSFISISRLVGANIGNVLMGILVDNTSMTTAFILVSIISFICLIITVPLLIHDKKNFPKLYSNNL